MSKELLEYIRLESVRRDVDRRLLAAWQQLSPNDIAELESGLISHGGRIFNKYDVHPSQLMLDPPTKLALPPC